MFSLIVFEKKLAEAVMYNPRNKPEYKEHKTHY